MTSLPVPRSLLSALAAAILLPLPAPHSGSAQQPYPAARHGGNYMHNYYFPPAPSSTPWAPAWMPDGESLVVSMSGSLWRVDPGTGEARELTQGPEYHSSPDVSPDGRWIVHTADDGGGTIQLRVLDVSTGESRALTDDDGIYTDPVFSPDGTRLAYVSTHPNGYFNAYVRPIRDGRWGGPEVAVTRDHRYPADRLYFGPWDMHITPAWLPDGRELLLVSNRDTPLGSGNVLRVPAEENGIERARVVLREQTLYRAQPDVSPDGKRFVYSSTRGAADQFNNLYLQPTEGGEPYKLTFFEHDAFHPRWSPDGEWIVYISNEGGLPQLELLETHGGARRRVAITGRRWARPVGTLTVTVRDAEAGSPTAARILLTAADGRFYAPEDAYARVGQGGGDPLFHTPGRFSLQLPAGRVELLAMKGFEFQPQRVEAEIRAGQATELSVDLPRMTDMSDRGWYSGSTHVHMNYAGNLHNTLENLLMMSAAEDQDIVNEQVANKDNRVLDHQFFVPGGKPHPLSTPERLLVVGQEYRPPFYGHVFMMGLRDHLISPFTMGYEGTAIESLYPSNTDMLRKARAQGATVGYVHAFFGERDPLEGNLGGAKGLFVDAALGTTDAVEWSEASRAGFHPTYALWNNGLRVTAVGGEDAISNLHRSKLVGSVRTYVHTGDRGLDMDAWYQGLREGRAFVTTGPLVELTVDGEMPGGTVELAAGGGTVELLGRVQSITPLERVMLIFNGEVVEEVPLPGDRRQVEFRRTLPVRESGWYHLRVEGSPEERFPLDAEYALAFTNPVWVSVGGRPVRDRAAAEYALRWLDELQAMAEAWPGWRSPREEEHVIGQFEEARAVYRRLLREAEEARGR